MVSDHPDPQDLGHAALALFQREILPSLPADLKYEGLMISRALSYAFSADRVTQMEGDTSAKYDRLARKVREADLTVSRDRQELFEEVRALTHAFSNSQTQKETE